MTREAAVLVMIGVAIVLIALGLWGWRRRARRDGGLVAPVADVPAAAREITRADVLYVATTRHDAPLERLTIRGLTFRARGQLIVTSAGIALDLTGSPRVFIARERITGADQATVAIDRVVEKNGLTRVSWTIQDDQIVDTYVRPQTISAYDLAESVRTLTPSTATPGGDA